MIKLRKNKKWSNWEDPLACYRDLRASEEESGSRPFGKNESEIVFPPHSETRSEWGHVGDATGKLSIDGVSRHAKILYLPISASLTTAGGTIHRNFCMSKRIFSCVTGRSSDALVYF